MKDTTKQWLDSIPQETLRGFERELFEKYKQIGLINIRLEGSDPEEFIEIGQERASHFRHE